MIGGGRATPATALATVLVAAATYDLTDLATAKDELNITDTSQDTWLARGITQISSAISSYCNRVFPAETMQDVVYPGRYGYGVSIRPDRTRLQLSRWPVATALVSITTTAAVASGVTVPVASVADVSVGQPLGIVGLSAVLPDGCTVAAVDSTGLMITLSSPLVAPLAAGASLWAGPVVRVTGLNGTVRTLDPTIDYLVDAASGQITRLREINAYPTAWPEERTSVTYQGGFSTIPPDVVDAALRLLTQRASSRDRDPMLKSFDQPGLGTSTYWVGSVPGVRGAFPSEISALLDNYRVPVIA